MSQRVCAPIKINRLFYCLLMCLLLGFSVQSGWTSTTIKHPSRAFGYVLGDQLTQRVNLSAINNTFELAEPLPLGRIGFWLERQSVVETTDKASDNWLEIRYQIVNSPVTVSNDELPALTLIGTSGDRLEIPASPYSLGPITSDQGAPTAALPLMQPDHTPEVGNMRRANRLLHQYGLALLATLLTWLAWWYWRQQKDRIKLPFAAAWHQIQRHDKSNASQHPEAWIAMHDALNRYGGKTVQQSSLHELIEKHSWIAPLQSKLEAFFTSSSGIFFEHPARIDSFPLNELSRELYQAEKRHSD